jgi:hypothetical protein
MFNSKNALDYSRVQKCKFSKIAIDFTWEAEVASSTFLSSLILKKRGKRREIPFSGST